MAVMLDLEMPAEKVPRFYADIINKLGDERDALRAEVERLREECHLSGKVQIAVGLQADSYAAENERLKAELDAIGRHSNVVAGEIHRLRAALEEVASISHSSLLPDRIVEIVTNALERERAVRGRSAP